MIWGPASRRPRCRTGSPATSRRRCHRWRCASCPATCRSATPQTEWEIGPATIRAASVAHRGPTLGYRITDGDTTLCYIPTTSRPRRRARRLEADWISGFELAHGAYDALPRLPVHQRGVPGPRRLGPLGASPTPSPSRVGSSRAHAALPPRPAALRRLPRRPLPRGARPLGGARGEPGAIEWRRSAPSSSSRPRRAPPSPEDSSGSDCGLVDERLSLLAELRADLLLWRRHVRERGHRGRPAPDWGLSRLHSSPSSCWPG